MSHDDVIFVREHGHLRRAERIAYDKEDLLQRLVAEHPELLAGGQIRPDDPVRWLLVCREAGITDRADGGDRWSVDHLLLDQHGVPTFAEVKRSRDTRIRREVVGQMLDYAANATQWWPVHKIRELAARAAGNEDALAERVAALLDCDPSDREPIEAYWTQVDRNLHSGNVRLLFIADEIRGSCAASSSTSTTTCRSSRSSGSRSCGTCMASSRRSCRGSSGRRSGRSPRARRHRGGRPRPTRSSRRARLPHGRSSRGSSRRCRGAACGSSGARRASACGSTG
ncbi:MAG: hypothetical protein R3F59_25600 [Myxococcota bacterium]